MWQAAQTIMTTKASILFDRRCPATQADKAHVCVRLLSLSDAMGPSSEQLATQEELVHAATALSQAAPLPGPLADLRLQNGEMDALRMLWAQVSASSLEQGLAAHLHCSLLSEAW